MRSSSLLAPLASLAFAATSSPALSTSAAPTSKRIAVIGGGASGTFAAISAADALLQSTEESPASSVVLYEASDDVLRSLRASGGHILHDTSKNVRELLMDGYPRGRKEITAALTKRFNPIAQRRWFEARGVEFATNRDGSVVADDEDVLLDAVKKAVADAGVDVPTGNKVIRVERSGTSFVLTISSQEESDEFSVTFDSVILATGSSFQGYQIAEALGHTVVEPVRSMYAFRSNAEQQTDPKGLMHVLRPGTKLSAPHARLSFKFKVAGQKRPRVFKAEGPLEFCASGNDAYLAGKAALKLSSFAAREIQEMNYKGRLYIHFCPEVGSVEKVEASLWQHRLDHPKELVSEKCPLSYREVDYDNYDFETESFAEYVAGCVPQGIWDNMSIMCGAATNARWGNLSPKKIRRLAELVVGCPFDFYGRHTMSGGFVNAGGVVLKEVNMSNMESRICSGLFYCGQVLDIDGSSVGYNSMRNWATGYIAGLSAAQHVQGNDKESS